MEEADKLIGAGKKHLVMGKVVEAVSSLQEACGMLAKTYGDTADECGEAFFWCGKALLDLARMENSVLGNALEGVPEEDEDNKPNDSKIESTEDIDEKTRDELRVQVYDAMAEKKAEDAEKKAEGKQSGDGDVEEESEDKENVEGKPSESKEQMDVETGDDQQKTKDEAKEEKMAEGDGDISESKSGDPEEESANQPEEESANQPEEESANQPEEESANQPEEESANQPEEAQGDEEDGDEGEMETETEAQGEEKGTAEKDSDDDEEVGNLQLAWEMLEVAKVIYKRKETKEDQLMAAQAYLKLGEVSTESGNYTQALEDFQECLKLQQKHLDSDSRLLAETHYQLGLTYSLNLEFNKAIEALNNSISVIKSRLDKLQALLDKAECPDALADERKEMDELKALLPEIQEKVEDATEGLKTASTATQAVKDVLDGGATTSASSVQSSGLSSSNANGTAINGDGVANGQTSTASVSDISHLVRKKRKPEESPVKEGVVKKVKQDDADGVQEAHTNGIDKATSDTKNMSVKPDS